MSAAKIRCQESGQDGFAHAGVRARDEYNSRLQSDRFLLALPGAQKKNRRNHDRVFQWQVRAEGTGGHLTG